MTAPKFHIAIAGIIGAGKTTLATALSQEMGLQLYKEPVEDNPYLEKFYEDQAQYAFPMQIYLLNRRFAQQQEIVWSPHAGAVQDRSIYEDGVFASMLHADGKISDLDFATYQSLFTNMANFMRRPTLIVFLDVSPAAAHERIQTRGRKCEETLPLAYLEKLHAAYERFVADIARTIPVLRIKYENFASVDAMATAVREFYDGLGCVHEWQQPAPIEPPVLVYQELPVRRSSFR